MVIIEPPDNETTSNNMKYVMTNTAFVMIPGNDSMRVAITLIVATIDGGMRQSIVFRKDVMIATGGTTGVTTPVMVTHTIKVIVSVLWSLARQ
jgi:hypothetical protein